MKPPCTERYARWCERTAANHRLLLDIGQMGGVCITVCNDAYTQNNVCKFACKIHEKMLRDHSIHFETSMILQMQERKKATKLFLFQADFHTKDIAKENIGGISEIGFEIALYQKQLDERNSDKGAAS